MSFRTFFLTQMNFAAWMYVSRDKQQAVVFAFSLNSDHWSNLVPRLQLQGLLRDAEYEVTQPMPNNIAQANGTLMVFETERECFFLNTVYSSVYVGSVWNHLQHC